MEKYLMVGVGAMQAPSPLNGRKSGLGELRGVSVLLQGAGLESRKGTSGVVGKTVTSTCEGG